jgi:hypothetical protein
MMKAIERALSVFLIVVLATVSVASAQGGNKGGGAGGGGSANQSSPSGGGGGNAPFESIMLAYGALDQAMHALARRTCLLAQQVDAREDPPLIVIADQASLANLSAYDAFDRTSRFLTSTYRAMIPPPSAFTFLTAALGGAPANASLGVNSAAGITQNDYIQIDQEQMLVTSSPLGNVVTVQRAQNGTPIAPHSAFTQVVDLTQLNAAPPEVATPAAAGGGGDTFSDITNAVAAVLVAGNAESGSTITIQDASAALTLSDHLLQEPGCANAEIVYPGVYGTSTSLTDFNRALDSVINTRQRALAALSTIPLPNGQGALPLRLTAFNSVDAIFSQFSQSWLAANSTTGLSAFTPIVQGYGLRQKLTVVRNPGFTSRVQRQIYMVYVNVAAAGATLQDRKNAITALTTGDWIRYSGGVVINSMIFRQTANPPLLFSDVLRYRSPLTTIHKPIREDSTHFGDNLGDTCPSGATGDACRTALSQQ